MSIAVILFNGAEPFQQIVNTLSTKGPTWNLVKMLKGFQRRRRLKITQFIHVYSPEARQITRRGQNFIVTEKF